MNKLARACLAALTALTVGAGVAYADATIYAAPPNQFFQGDVTIAQGEAVTFTNGDTVMHDVTATAKGADGKPLFASAQVGTAQSAPVAGVEFLGSGSYPYICSIHPFMKGTITVSSAGTPKPRPGSGDGSGGQAAPAAVDTKAPALTVRLLDTKRAQVRKRRSLQLSVGSDEAASLGIVARAGKTVVATGNVKFTQATTRKLTVKLTKAGLKASKQSKPLKLAVEVHATDASGNSSAAATSGRLR